MRLTDEPEVVVDLTAWAPWAREFIGILDAVRVIGASSDDDSVRRLRLLELGARTRRLLSERGCQPELPGVFGRALEVLRSPSDADPIHISEAIARLSHLAVVIDADALRPARRGGRRRVRVVIDQEQLPGMETVNINEGATR